MPPLYISWARGGRSTTSSRLTPAQRVVRVLQVTQANWAVISGVRHKKRDGGMGPFARETAENV